MKDITRKALEMYLADEEKILASLDAKMQRAREKNEAARLKLEFTNEAEIQEAFGGGWITEKKREKALDLLNGIADDAVLVEYRAILELNLRQMRMELRYD